MKAIITNYRYWVLSLIFFVAVIGFVGMPHDDLPFLPFLAAFLGSKLIGLAALVAFCLLFRHWQGKGEIPELTELTAEE